MGSIRAPYAACRACRRVRDRRNPRSLLWRPLLQTVAGGAPWPVHGRMAELKDPGGRHPSHPQPNIARELQSNSFGIKWIVAAAIALAIGMRIAKCVFRRFPPRCFDFSPRCSGRCPSVWSAS
jgi:hypothetical protein